MLTAIPRYGARVLPNTDQIVSALARQRQLVRGPHVRAFEEAFARRLGGVRAVSTSFGRMAFYYILRALEFPAGAEIVMPAFTFWVMPEIARVAGLRPVFADVDPTTFAMTADSLSRVLTPNTVAVVPTHMWGLPCDMDELLAVARRARLVVIEDCAQAFGAVYRGRAVGTLGDAALFSFQALKPINTYGGGMAVTANARLADRIAQLVEAEEWPDESAVRGLLWRGRIQRISIKPRVFTWTLFPILWAASLAGADPNVFLWEKIQSLDPLPPSYRKRLSNAQAAIGLAALEHVDRWTAGAQVHAARMTQLLQTVPGIRVPYVPADRTHIFYQYCVYLPNRSAVLRRCLREGVDLETLHVDVCTELDLFKDFTSAAPGAAATKHAVQIPIYESLTASQLERVGLVVQRAAAELGAARATSIASRA